MFKNNLCRDRAWEKQKNIDQSQSRKNEENFSTQVKNEEKISEWLVLYEKFKKQEVKNWVYADNLSKSGKPTSIKTENIIFEVITEVEVCEVSSFPILCDFRDIVIKNNFFHFFHFFSLSFRISRKFLQGKPGDLWHWKYFWIVIVYCEVLFNLFFFRFFSF
jgi:hypothetical protein